MYKLTQTNSFITSKSSVIRLLDNACIPFDESNTDYQAYLKWLDGYEPQFNSETQQTSWVKTSDGNTPLPADDPTQE